jgi:hypothetical protein
VLLVAVAPALRLFRRRRAGRRPSISPR